MWPAFTTPCIGCDLPHCWQRYSKPEIDARKRYRDIRSVVTQDVGYQNENHCTPRSSVLRSRGFHDENLSDLHATKEGLVFGIRRNCPLFVISNATRASPIFHVAASFIISFFCESSMSASHQRTPSYSQLPHRHFLPPGLTVVQSAGYHGPIPRHSYLRRTIVACTTNVRPSRMCYTIQHSAIVLAIAVFTAELMTYTSITAF